MLSFSLVLSCVVVAATFAATVTPPDCSWRQCKASHTWDETACACMCTLRGDEDPAWFRQSVWGHWFRMPCSAGTYYNSAGCDCSLRAPYKALISQNFPLEQTGGASHKCLTLVDLQLDGTQFVDLTQNWIDAENEANISVVDAANATDGKAALFAGSAVLLPAFEYNDLTSTAQVNLRFQLEAGRASEENVTQVLFTNACPKENEPSLAMSFTPSSGQLDVTVATAQVILNLTCSDISPDESGWYTVVLAVEQSKASVLVNGQQCASRQGAGSIRTTACGLTIGGGPLASDNSAHFFGYLDYFTVKKHCTTV